jgi:anion-transporting  ArsA/GET3 family ATPase
VLDTPPAAHALDFVRAPERMDRLLAPEVAGLLTRPHPRAARFFARIERATGKEALRDVSEFANSFQKLFEAIRRRSLESRALLRSDRTAFVLVTGPNALEGSESLGSRMESLGIPLRAVIQNRVHPLPGALDANAEKDASTLFRELESAGATQESIAWLRNIHLDALVMARAEQRCWRKLELTLPKDIARTRIPELDHDVHSLADLSELGRRLLGQ